jgi:hypothetical protein
MPLEWTIVKSIRWAMGRGPVRGAPVSESRGSGVWRERGGEGRGAHLYWLRSQDRYSPTGTARTAIGIKPW